MEMNINTNGGSNHADQLRELVDKAEELLGSFGDDTSTGVRELRERVANTLRNSKARLGDVTAQVNKFASETVSKTDGYVRDNPWTAVGIAAAAGIVVGALVSRRI